MLMSFSPTLSLSCAWASQAQRLLFLEGEMRPHHLLMPFLGVVLITAPALAQTGQVAPPSPQSSAGGWIIKLHPDQWRASDLEGLHVYSSNNGDKIGDISELIFDSSGKVQAVVIGVGGYLGIGERGIAVPFEEIRFETQPRGAATGTTTGEARLAGTSPGGGTVASPAATGTAAVPAGSSPAAPNTPAPGAPGTSGLGQVAPAGSRSTPDHAVFIMSVTKDELRTAPEFRTTR
ncbi:PRC-barrel domain-containing protein [Microvirga sp. 3-52]|uniref:PRC-barrel domain-containing protein n=1 Tax=Microvirga sp. 3-52 TaxID=2792425 RepID=UPI0020C05A14|nr:PRC-barrel domain-containing protein [Microvirga sp. 3-52]